MERLLHASHERKCAVFAVMKNPVVTATFQAKTRESVEAFVEFVERTGAMLMRPAVAAVPTEAVPTQPGSVSLQGWADRFLDEIGYFNDLRRAEKTPEAAEARIRSVKEMMLTLDKAGDAGTSLAERLQRFLEEVTLDTEREEEDKGPSDAVTLITMHSCKGLEFPHVYIVGLEEGLLPHSRSTETPATLDEERRLFYVGITRAMQTLTISHCSSRKKFGTMTPCHPSRFLGELPRELVEHANEKAKTPVKAEAGKDLFAMMRGSLDEEAELSGGIKGNELAPRPVL
jgi:superfamily I DNA/RNA helicase